MTKREEMENPNSCWNKSGMDELVFVVGARDLAAAPTVYDWVAHRLGLCLNRITDAQIREALTYAPRMAAQGREIAQRKAASKRAAAKKGTQGPGTGKESV